MIAELAKALNDLNIEVIAPVTEHISVGGWIDSDSVIHSFWQSHMGQECQAGDLAKRISSIAGEKVQFGLCPLVPVGTGCETIGFFQSGNIRGRVTRCAGSDRLDVVYRAAP